MTKPIEMLVDQNRDVDRLVELVEREIGRVEDGGMPNTALLLDIMQYITRYADVFHQALERRLLAKLSSKAGEREALDACQQDQRAMQQRAQDFVAVLEAVREEQLVERETFVREGRAFVEARRRYVDRDEATVLPALARGLADADIAAVEHEFRHRRDPVLDGMVEAEYRQLYDFILRSA